MQPSVSSSSPATPLTPRHAAVMGSKEKTLTHLGLTVPGRQVLLWWAKVWCATGERETQNGSRPVDRISEEVKERIGLR